MYGEFLLKHCNCPTLFFTHENRSQQNFGKTDLHLEVQHEVLNRVQQLSLKLRDTLCELLQRKLQPLKDWQF